MIGACGYGRYDDDPSHVGCPRAQSDMTPCIARDGHTALHDKLGCVYCDAKPGVLLNELASAGVSEAVEFVQPRSLRPSAATQADKLREIVRVVTEPGTEVPYRHTFPCGCVLGFEDERFWAEVCSDDHRRAIEECKPMSEVKVR